MTQPGWPPRIIANGIVDVQGAAATLLGSAGIVASVTYIGVGHYAVNLRPPGVPQNNVYGSTPIVTPIGSAFAAATASYADDSTLHVFVFDEGGLALDFSFSFAIVLNEREGGQA